MQTYECEFRNSDKSSLIIHIDAESEEDAKKTLINVLIAQGCVEFNLISK